MALNPSVEFAGRITGPDSNYTYGSAKNDTSPGAFDGTPWRKALLDDIFGAQQALLVEAGITPSGNAETVLASQYLDAMKSIIHGSGMLGLGVFNGTTTNADDSIVIKKSDGTDLSSTNYGFIITRSPTSQVPIATKIIANITIDLTGANWGEGTLGDLADAALRIVAIRDTSSLKIGVAFEGGRTFITTGDTTAIPSSANSSEKVLVSSALASDAHMMEIGWVKANFDDTGGAAEDLWTIQSGNDDLHSTPLVSIVNTVEAIVTGVPSIASAVFAALSGMSATITPRFANSKIKISIVLNFGSAAGGRFVMAKLKRGATEILLGDTAGSRIRASTAAYFEGPAAIYSQNINFTDSPRVATPTVYSIDWATSLGDVGYLNRSGTDTDSSGFTRLASVITVTEV